MGQITAAAVLSGECLAGVWTGAGASHCSTTSSVYCPTPSRSWPASMKEEASISLLFIAKNHPYVNFNVHTFI